MMRVTAPVESRIRVSPERKQARQVAESIAGLVESPWFPFAELLEARIIPEEIEHGIKPEQRRSEVARFALVSAAKS